MKNICLVSILFFFFLNSSAQITKPSNTQQYSPSEHKLKNHGTKISGALNKNTNSHSSWFNYAIAAQSFTPSGLLYPIYNDSSILVTGSLNPFNWWLMGVGCSFDPTSSWFLYSNYNPYSLSAQYNLFTPDTPSIIVSANDAYDIDSIVVDGLYIRQPYNNYVDTLLIDVFAVNQTPGTYLIGTFDTAFADISPTDSIVRVATGIYDPNSNSFNADSISGLVRIVKILDYSAYSDSLVSGLHEWKLPLPSNLHVNAGGKVVAFEHYKSGHNYNFNCNIDSVNIWHVLSISLNGSSYTTQLPNDYNTGIIASIYDKYYDATANPIDYWQGHHILNSDYITLFGNPVQDPMISFHVTNCSTCTANRPPGERVINVGNDIRCDVYPNPAKGVTNLSFSLNTSEDVTITISDMAGRTVMQEKRSKTRGDKIPIECLNAGVYFYTVLASESVKIGKFIIE